MANDELLFDLDLDRLVALKLLPPVEEAAFVDLGEGRYQPREVTLGARAAMLHYLEVMAGFILSPEQQQEQPIDPALQVQIADIEQRKLEVESKERLAHLNIEADGYKTQMSIELDKEKLEQEKYLAELKVNEQQQLAEQKYQIELLKLQLNEKEKVIDTLTKEQEINSKNELELLKLEYKAKEAELKAQVEALRSQISSIPKKEEVIYE